MKITVLENIQKANDVIAEEIRAELDSNQVLAINMMSSPGSGKTTLLERSCEFFGEKGVRIGIIEGDMETTRDADRLQKFNVPIVQIQTGSAEMAMAVLHLEKRINIASNARKCLSHVLRPHGLLELQLGLDLFQLVKLFRFLRQDVFQRGEVLRPEQADLQSFIAELFQVVQIHSASL